MSVDTKSHRLFETFPLTRTPAVIDLHDDITAAITDAIWAEKSDSGEGKDILAYWFRFYQDETTSTTVLRNSIPGIVPIRTHAELIGFIQLLKKNPLQPRAQLKRLWQSSTFRTTTHDTVDIDGALDLAVRLMFMAACRTPSSFNIIYTGQIFKPSWKDQESLKQFVETIFPRYELNQASGAELIRTEKFSAHYLAEYVDVQVKWTNHLPDHLILQRTNDGKYLYVFSHAGFLETCSRASEKQKPNDRELVSGSLPFELANETLRTLNLLFPPQDKRSSILLAQYIRNNALDQRLATSSLHPIFHHTPRDALQPSDVRSLGEKFPYWGERLYTLWREADNPAPISKLGWWSESKKSPRFTYWAGVIALSLAIFFGIISSVLSAAQVWVSYSAWKRPNIR